MSKETVKLPSVHWQWTTDWMIDFHTPGGTDHDGWEYATDFPASYHGKTKFTDYVRRRRWARKCKLSTSGPWKLVGATKLLDVTMTTSKASGKVMVWVVSSKGDVLFRTGVTSRCPEGQDWEQVASDSLFQAITIGGRGDDKCPWKVWGVTKEGSAFLRHGITEVAPTGQLWLQLHPPSGATLKAVTAGDWTLWALDTSGRLWLRQEITPVFPEGTSWTQVPCVPGNGCSFTGGEVKSISAVGNELWAVLDNITPILSGSTAAAAAAMAAAAGNAAFGVASAAINATGYGQSGPVNGVICRRSGITPGEPMGVGWDIVIGVRFFNCVFCNNAPRI